MPRPDLLSAFTWNDFEDYVLTVFATALRELRKQADLPRPEVFLNRELLTHSKNAHFSLSQGGNGFPMTILLDATNQPQPDDSARAARLRKKPDFQCALFNSSAQSAEESQVFYCIECKRLGEPERSNRVFNENYTQHGILRFQEIEHAYAKGFSSGAMIGYLQSMQPSNALNEVNATAKANGFPKISSPKKWKSQEATRLGSQIFRRNFPSETFTLHHLWVDLRNAKHRLS